jgi:hypothetical protein
MHGQLHTDKEERLWIRAGDFVKAAYLSTVRSTTCLTAGCEMHLKLMLLVTTGSYPTDERSQELKRLFEMLPLSAQHELQALYVEPPKPSSVPAAGIVAALEYVASAFRAPPDLTGQIAFRSAALAVCIAAREWVLIERPSLLLDTVLDDDRVTRPSRTSSSWRGESSKNVG